MANQGEEIAAPEAGRLDLSQFAARGGNLPAAGRLDGVLGRQYLGRNWLLQGPRHERNMAITRTLEDFHFSRAATLEWQDEVFDFSAIDPEWRRVRNLIYVYVDVEHNRYLNVGQTGQCFRARIGQYKGWLNGQHQNDCDTRIRHEWLACLGTCRSSQVEVWVKPSSADGGQRKAEEARWIETLKPILNRK
jgi:hypothetical protein